MDPIRASRHLGSLTMGLQEGLRTRRRLWAILPALFIGCGSAAPADDTTGTGGGTSSTSSSSSSASSSSSSGSSSGGSVGTTTTTGSSTGTSSASTTGTSKPPNYFDAGWACAPYVVGSSCADSTPHGCANLNEMCSQSGGTAACSSWGCDTGYPPDTGAASGGTCNSNADCQVGLACSGGSCSPCLTSGTQLSGNPSCTPSLCCSGACVAPTDREQCQ